MRLSKQHDRGSSNSQDWNGVRSADRHYHEAIVVGVTERPLARGGPLGTRLGEWVFRPCVRKLALAS